MYDAEFFREARQKALTLTLALYRVTALFPKEEPLRLKIRQAADEILGETVELGYRGNEKKEEIIAAKTAVIKVLLEVAREMRFAKPLNFLALEREYESLANFCQKAVKQSEKLYSWHNFTRHLSVNEQKGAGFIEEKAMPEITSPATAVVVSSNGISELNERQKAILTLVKSVGEARLSDFFEKFKGISSKTIQRDLHYLVENELLKRVGERRWTTYTIL